jgi:hypothetical protein
MGDRGGRGCGTGRPAGPGPGAAGEGTAGYSSYPADRTAILRGAICGRRGGAMSDTAAAWGLGGELARARAQGPGRPGSLRRRNHAAMAIPRRQERRQCGPNGGGVRTGLLVCPLPGPLPGC